MELLLLHYFTAYYFCSISSATSVTVFFCPHQLLLHLWLLWLYCAFGTLFSKFLHCLCCATTFLEYLILLLCPPSLSLFVSLLLCLLQLLPCNFHPLFCYFTTFCSVTPAVTSLAATTFLLPLPLATSYFATLFLPYVLQLILFCLQLLLLLLTASSPTVTSFLPPLAAATSLLLIFCILFLLIQATFSVASLNCCLCSTAALALLLPLSLPATSSCWSYCYFTAAASSYYYFSACSSCYLYCSFSAFSSCCLCYCYYLLLPQSLLSVLQSLSSLFLSLSAASSAAAAALLCCYVSFPFFGFQFSKLQLF